jgi:amino acid adenylation domain-containing protein
MTKPLPQATAGGIAIIGMSGRFPGARNVAEFWDNLKNGVESISFFSDEELSAAGVSQVLLKDPNYVKARGVVAGIELFDARFFGFSAREAELLDPQHRLLLECAWEAFEDAGYTPDSHDGQTGVFAGGSASSYIYNLLLNPGVMASMGRAQVVFANSSDFLATRISYKLNLKGPSLTIQTACSTSLAAVCLACESLVSYQCDLALAGGVTVAVPQKLGYHYQEGGVMSADGHCRALDAGATGTVGGDGAAMIVLKRIAEAIADGDHIYAVIRGWSLNNDGADKVGFTAPSVRGQSEVIVSAQAMAGAEPDTITYVEAHGTGTRLGDPIELMALTEAFRSRSDKKQYCAIGSVKTNVGHLDAAAGVTGLIKTSLALKTGVIPASLHFKSADPGFDLEGTPFFVNSAKTEWRPTECPRRAGVSSFGMGGTNVHVVVEEPPGQAESGSSRQWQHLTLSARSQSALDSAAAGLAAHLRENPSINLADVTFTLQTGRRAFQHRRVVVCDTVETAIARLEGTDQAGVFDGIQEMRDRPAAFMFSGQGTQYVRMGFEVYRSEKVFRDTLDECSEMLIPELGLDLRSILYPASPEQEERAALQINQTWLTQPALFAVEYALARLWMSWGVRPKGMIGHSIGEYVAACVAGTLTLPDALSLVSARGRIMQRAPKGAMLAVPLPEAEVRAAINGKLSIGAINAPSLCVVSGAMDDIDEFEQQLAARSIAGRRLRTSHAFHSSMMEFAVGLFLEEISRATLHSPEIPFISNVSGSWITQEEASSPAYWGRHLRQTVRYADGLVELMRAGDPILLEVGPGETLTRLAARSAHEAGQTIAIPSLPRRDSTHSESEMLACAAARLWAAGCSLDWHELNRGEDRRRLPLPTYPFERERYWIEPSTTSRYQTTGSIDASKKADLADWFYIPVWRHSAPVAVRGDARENTCWVVFLDSIGIGEAITERLRRQGRRVITVVAGAEFARLGEDSYSVNPRAAAEYQTLFDEIEKTSLLPASLLHLWNLAESGGPLSAESLEHSETLSFFSLLYLAQSLAERDISERIGLLVLSNDLHDVTGNETLRPEQAVLLGPCNVIQSELSNINCRNVDITLRDFEAGRLEQGVDRIWPELFSGSTESPVACRGTRRWVRTFEPMRLEKPQREPSRLVHRGVYLITGGLGGIGLVLAEYLAKTVNARLVLVGRSPFPRREDWDSWLESHKNQDRTSRTIRRLQAIEQIGSEVIVFSADAADLHRMREVVREASLRFGRIDGAIHSAGVAGGGMIRLKTEEAASAVLAPKTRGSVVLAEVLREHQPDFIILCSSGASIIGGYGQIDYCAANAFLDHFARSNALNTGTDTISVNWDTWQEAGMAVETVMPASFGEIREQSLKHKILSSEGADAFARILDSPVSQVIVSTRDFNALFKRRIENRGKDPLKELETRVVARSSHARPAISTPYVAPRTELEQQLSVVWSELLGVDRIGVTDNFFELGGHSLLAAQLALRVKVVAGIVLPIRELFDKPTIAEIAESIEQTRAAEHESGPPRLVPVPRDKELPLSFGQHRLWFLDQLEPGTSSFNLWNSLRIRGLFDTSALEAAVNRVVERHEVLRTTFHSIEGTPLQRIHPADQARVPVLDLSECGPDFQADALQRVATRECQTPFYLTACPLIRATVFRLGPQDHLVIFVMHHIVSDGWSNPIFVRDLKAFYEAHVAGGLPPLRPLPIQYADYAHWQRRRFDEGLLDEFVGYWLRKLEGAPGTIDLPSDHPRPAVQTFRGRRRPWRLSPECRTSLLSLSQRAGATTFMSLLTIFDILLHGYSGQTDLSVGVPVANRNRLEVEELIGFFVNTLVLRADLSGDPSFLEALGRIREITLEAIANQEAPFEKVVEALNPERDLSRSPLFQVMFIFQSAPDSAQQSSNDAEMMPDSPPGGAQFDLTLSVIETREDLRAHLEYNADLFELSTIDRMIEHLETITQAVIADPERRLSDLMILTPEEQRSALIEFNETEQDYPADLCIHQLIEAQAEATPSSIAVVFEENYLSYGDLNWRANRLAHYLLRHGASEEVRVGICLERSPDLIASLLATLKSGAAYVPLDPTYPRNRLLAVLQDAGCSILITNERLRAELWLPVSPTICLDSQAGEIARESSDNPQSRVTSQNLAYVLHTSGSLGRPKGIMIAHSNVVNFFTGMDTRIGCGPGDTLLAVTGFSFDISVLELLWTLARGARVLVADSAVEAERDSLKSADRRIGGDYSVLAQATRFAPTLMQCTPSMVRMLLVDEQAAELRGLRALMVGGEPLPLSLAREVYEKIGVRIINMYGPTETTIWSSTHALDDAGACIQIGRPIANTSMYVLNLSGQPVPPGAAGELHIGGDGLSRGYRNMPAATAERFIPDRLSSRRGARLYKTGDLVRLLPEGGLEFLGRIDFQVKIRGHRIELAEIEAALIEHPDVKEALVIAHEEQPGHKELIAYLLTEADRTPGSSQLRAVLRTSLPDVMVPSAFVCLDAFPLTLNGKVDRKALPLPGGSEGRDAAGLTAQQSPVEEMLALIWSHLLRRDRIDSGDSFFEIGGHSLSATQLISRIRDAFSVDLPLRAIFEAPTLSGLASRIETSMRSEPAELVLPVGPVSTDRPLPLSFAQERLWFLDKMQPGSPIYNISSALRLNGPLDIPAFRNSLSELVRRHEILRTSYPSVDGQAVQLIAPPAPGRYLLVDASELPDDVRETELRRLVDLDGQLPFDLSAGPILRVILLRLNQEEHAVMFTTHHIACDAWSMGILTNEFSELYRAFRAGKASPLPELPIQYGDYAAWERDQFGEGRCEQSLSFWRAELADDLPVLELPADRPRPPVQTFAGAVERFAIDEAVTKGLRVLARDEGATLFMTLLAAFSVLLHRYTSQDRIIVGTPIAGRSRAETEALIGCFINTMVIATDLSGDASFREVLARVRNGFLDAFVHREVPFERLVDELRPERDLSRSPLFQVMFVLQNAPRGALDLPDLAAAPLNRESFTAMFDMTLTMVEADERIAAAINYNTDLFDPETIQKMVEQFQILLTAIAQHPAESISKLPLVGDADLAQILLEWNDSGTDYPSDACIHELFAELAEQTPDATAVAFNDDLISYRELNLRANKLANHLATMGAGPEVLVGIFIERSIDLIVALLATLKAGGAYLPIDPALPLQRIDFLLEDGPIGLLLTHEHLVDRLPVTRAQVITLDSDQEMLSRESDERPVNSTCSSNLAYILYTSGSTGVPKGVGVSHQSVVRLVRNVNFARLDSSEVFLQHSPLSFDASTFEIWGSLLNGARLVMMSPGLFSLQELATATQERGVTTLWLTAGLFNLIVDEQLDSLRGLRQLLAGGEALSPAHVNKALATLDATLINGYGPTESTTFACYHRIERAAAANGTVPIGRPISNTRVYVLDHQMEPVPVGVTGEIFIAGDGLARGYHNRAGQTAAAFLPNPYSVNGGRVYRTGDKGKYLKDGNIDFLGREDEQVKLRGFRIEPGEIEHAIGAIPRVRAVAVVVRQDDCGEKRLVAYVACHDRSPETAAELRQAIADKLPDCMVPSIIVLLDELPITRNGKIDRKALPEPVVDGSPASATTARPRNSFEELLVAVWSQVLGVEQIGVNDSFFDLGGHSLLAIQLTSRIRDAFGVDIPVSFLFEHPVISALAARISSMITAGDNMKVAPIRRIPGAGAAPLSFAQQRLWFFDQMEPGSPAYNVPRAYRLEGKMDLSAFEKTLTEIVRRHAVLRTTFDNIDGVPMQVIGAARPVGVGVIDLSALSELDRENEARRLANREARRPFNLSSGPMFRVSVIRMAPRDQLILFMMHHIVTDDWSFGVLTDEISVLYSAFSKGEPADLPELEIQYSDYAYWQRDRLSGDQLDSHLAYWRTRLGGDLPVLNLADRQRRSSTRTYRGAYLPFTLDRELSESIRKLSRQEGVTLFMFLLSAFDTFLYHQTEKEDLLVGTVIANRSARETEALIGFFVNTIVMRSDLSGSPSFRQLLLRNRKTALDAYAHQEVPFEKIVEELQPERYLNRSPFAEVFFGMLNTPGQSGARSESAIRPVDLSFEFVRLDLTLWMSDRGDCLQGTWTYDSELFESSTIAMMNRRFRGLLEEIVSRPDANIDELRTITDAEKQERARQEELLRERVYEKFKSAKPKPVQASH